MNVFLSLLLKALCFYLGLLASTGTMSAMGNSVGSFIYRILVSYLMLVLCALYGAMASVVLRLVGQHRMAQWYTSSAFYWTMKLSAGVQFDVVSGNEYLLQTRPAVFVANHQSSLDVLLLASIWPRWTSVTAKKSLKYTPFLGWFMALSGTVFIDRGNRQTALKAFEGAAAEIRTHRQNVFIFPEGTRSNPDKPMLLGFKKGAFHLAVQAKVPIVPVVACCYHGLLSPKERRFRRGNIPVVGGYHFLSVQRERSAWVSKPSAASAASKLTPESPSPNPDGGPRRGRRRSAYHLRARAHAASSHDPDRELDWPASIPRRPAAACSADGGHRRGEPSAERGGSADRGGYAGAAGIPEQDRSQVRDVG